MAHGPHHLFSSDSFLGLAVDEPFLDKTVVQNTNLGIILVNRTKVRRTFPPDIPRTRRFTGDTFVATAMILRQLLLVATQKVRNPRKCT